MSSPVERVRDRHHQLLPLPLQRQDRVLARERAREGARDELRVELDRVDLAPREPHPLGEGLGDAVLVERLALAARVLELEGGEQLDRRELRPAKRAAARAAALLAQEAGALHVLAGVGGPLLVLW